MRLPAIPINQVYSLGKEVPMAPVWTAERVGAAALITAKESRDMAGIYLNRQIAADTQKAKIYATRQLLKWRVENDGKEYYRGSELSESIPVNKRTLNVDLRKGIITESEVEDIPAYEVRHHLYKEFMKGNIQASASRIRNDKARTAFTRDMEIMSEEKYLDLSVKAMLNQKEAVFKEEDRTVTEALQQKEYGIARSIIGNMDITDTARSLYYTRVDKAEEYDTYMEILVDGRDATTEAEIAMVEKYVDSALGTLSNEAEYKGYLDPPERAELASKLSTLTTALRSRRKAMGKARSERLTARLRTLKEQLNLGTYYGASASTNVASLIREGMVAGKGGDVTIQILMEEIGRGMGSQMLATEMAASHPIVANILLREFEDRIGDSPEAQEEYTKMQRVRENQRTGLAKNTLEYGVKVGWIQREPITLLGKDVSLSISRRQDQVDTVRAASGEYKDFFFTDELNYVGSTIDGMVDPNEKLGLAVAIHNAIGDRSSVLYDQLNRKKVGGSFSIAGRLVQQKNPVAGRHVLIGESFRKDNPQRYKPFDAELNSYLREKFEGAFSGQGGVHGSMMAAGRNIYASLSTSSEYDEDTAVLTYNLLTGGGMLEQGGGKFVRPDPEVTQDKWDRFIKNMAPAALETMGELDGYDSAALLKRIKKGDIEFVGRDSQSQALRDPVTGMFILDKATENPFQFRYQEGLKTMEEVRKDKMMGHLTSQEYKDMLDYAEARGYHNLPTKTKGAEIYKTLKTMRGQLVEAHRKEIERTSGGSQVRDEKLKSFYKKTGKQLDTLLLGDPVLGGMYKSLKAGKKRHSQVR